jgi:hypothetical protein
VAFWLFDEASGNIARDNSGHGYDADLKENPVWVDGKFRQALEFQGESYLEIRNSGQNLPFGGSAPFTIAAWVKNQGGGTVISKFNGGIIGAYILAVNGSGIVTFHREVNPWTFTGSMALPDNDFVHLAVTYDGAEMKIYINGEFDSGQDRGPQNTDTVTPVLIGARFTNDVPSEFFNGVLDEVALFNVALTEQQIREIMYGLSFPKASSPNPADGDFYEDTWVSLTWSPGDSAVSHEVYLGENLDDVFDAAHDSAFYRGNQTSAFYMAGFPGFAYPDGLVPGVTYYWRIDEVNDANPNSPWKGNVWSFSIPPKTAYSPNPADGAGLLDQDDVKLSWTAGFGAVFHTVYIGNDYDEVSNAVGGMMQDATTYNAGTLEAEKVYYWRVDGFDLFETYKSDVWTFTTPGAVGNPQPANGDDDVPMVILLSWTAADNAASHQVYLGLDKDNLRNADTGSPEYKGTRTLGNESYDPGSLELGTTYFWRVDEVYNGNPTKGPVWSFTVGDYLMVDDFESYNDLDEGEQGSNRIYLAWLDGYDNPAINGSVVGNAAAPFVEHTIIHGGSQSMPMSYDNGVGKSEATLTLTSSRDWTFKGVNTLTIWFRGESANAAENLYVALNDSAVVNHDNPDAALATSWTQWNIELQAFADQGVDLTNVTSITLGLGNRANPTAGGTGAMYFDDIRLYRVKP